MATLSPPPTASPLTEKDGTPTSSWSRWFSLLQSILDRYSTPSGSQAPTLASGWVNFGATFSTASYSRDAASLVRLSGLIKSGAVPSTAFTLPAGFRPSATELFNQNTSPGTATCRVDVQADGQVVVQSGSNVWVSLSGIAFYAAQ